TVPVPVVARAISAAPAAAISAASAAATATVVDVVDDSAVVTGRVAATAASPSAAHPRIRAIAVIHDGVAGVDVVSATNPPVAVATPIADAPIVAVARTGSVVGPAGSVVGPAGSVSATSPRPLNTTTVAARSITGPAGPITPATAGPLDPAAVAAGSITGPAGPTATANLSTAAGSIAADAADRARK